MRLGKTGNRPDFLRHHPACRENGDDREGHFMDHRGRRPDGGGERNDADRALQEMALAGDQQRRARRKAVLPKRLRPRWSRPAETGNRCRCLCAPPPWRNKWRSSGLARSRVPSRHRRSIRHVTNASTMNWFLDCGTRASRAMALRKNGVVASARLRTRMRVICMVNGSSIHRPW